MKIALCIPTRGVIFARTIVSTILSPRLVGAHVIIVDGLPIPDSHNECIRRALKTDCTHILFVEEDMVIPDRGLELMIAYANEGQKYVAIDYPITLQGRTTIKYVGSTAMFTGFGCTLLDRRLFTDYDLHDPWLTDEYAFQIEMDNHNVERFIRHKRENNEKTYGMFDIKFGDDMQRNGIKIKVISGIVCPHLRMRTWERKVVNHGVHDIYEL